MSREDRLIYERVKKDRITIPFLTTDHVEYIKNVLIDALRDTFSRDPDYPYIYDPATGDPMWGDPGGGKGLNPNLGIVIRDVYDYNVEFLPAITVRVNGGTVDDVSFSQNQFTYNYVRDETGALVMDAFNRPIPLSQEFSGIYNTTATLFIHAFDTVSREEITTRVAILFKHLLRDQLYADCGLFVKNVSISGETETPYQEGNDYIYSQSITLEILTGWNNRIPVGEELEAVNLQITGTGITPMDWMDETHPCMELALEDALEFRGDPMNPEAFVTRDWLELLTVTYGVTIEEAIVQINGGSSLERTLQQYADRLRQRATNYRNNKSSAQISGSPGAGFTYRFRDGTRILPDNTVVFSNNVRIDPSDTMVTTTGVEVTKTNAVTLPSYGTDANIDIHAFVDPFTATTLENLTAWNYFLILLYVKSAAMQSIGGLNKLIDEYISTLTDVRQILFMQNLRTEINELAEHRFLLGKYYPDIVLNLS